MAERYKDWLKQSESDLKHSRNALKDGDYEWSCFAAQQAAEKAVKALFMKINKEAWGHTVSILLSNLPEDLKPEQKLIDKAKILDKHYIPSRYPNGFEMGAPVDFYTKEEAENSIKIAEEIIEFCKSNIS